MARQIAAGIDIGTFQTKAVIAEEVLDNGREIPKIIGTGLAESRGISRGYITNPEETAKCIMAALTRAERTAGAKVKRAYFSAGGVGLGSISSSGSVAISRADLEITEKDLELVLEAAEAAIPEEAISNRRIINSIPLEYKIDGKPVWGRVEELKAHKLELRALFLTAHDHHLQDIIRAAELAGVEAIDLVAGPVAASFVTLSKRQKKAGSMLADIGAETTSVVVFENDNLVSLEVFPVGGSDLTNTIALGLKIPLEEAEAIKRGSVTRASFPKKKLDDIISAELEASFELIDEHLKKIGRDALLPAGIILTGGGSATAGIEELALAHLDLPAQAAEIHFGSNPRDRVVDNIWSVACGLSIVGFNADNEQTLVGDSSQLSIRGGLRRSARKLANLVSQFLP